MSCKVNGRATPTQTVRAKERSTTTLGSDWTTTQKPRVIYGNYARVFAVNERVCDIDVCVTSRNSQPMGCTAAKQRHAPVPEQVKKPRPSGRCFIDNAITGRTRQFVKWQRSLASETHTRRKADDIFNREGQRKSIDVVPASFYTQTFLFSLQRWMPRLWWALLWSHSAPYWSSVKLTSQI